MSEYRYFFFCKEKKKKKKIEKKYLFNMSLLKTLIEGKVFNF